MQTAGAAAEHQREAMLTKPILTIIECVCCTPYCAEVSKLPAVSIDRAHLVRCRVSRGVRHEAVHRDRLEEQRKGSFGIHLSLDLDNRGEMDPFGGEGKCSLLCFQVHWFLCKSDDELM